MKYFLMIFCLNALLLINGCGKEGSAGENSQAVYAKNVDAKKVTIDELSEYLPSGTKIYIQINDELLDFPAEASKIPKKVYPLFNRKISFRVAKGKTAEVIIAKMEKCLKVPVRLENNKLIIQTKN